MTLFQSLAAQESDISLPTSLESTSVSLTSLLRIQSRLLLSFRVFLFVPAWFPEPGCRRARPLQPVRDRGTQRLNAGRPLHRLRQSASPSEENGAAPQEPVRSGVSSFTV